MADAPPATRPNTATNWNSRVGGLPRWAWLPIIGGGSGLLFIYMRRRSAAKASATATPVAQGSAGSTTDQTAGLATDQAEAIYAQLRDIQGFVSTPPVGTPGATGPAGPPGPTGPPATATQPPAPEPTPVPPVPGPGPGSGSPPPAESQNYPAPPPPPPVSITPAPPRPQFLFATSTGQYSLNDLARWNKSSPAAIISATRQSEPYDVGNPASRLYQYLSRNNYNALLPAGYKFAIPVNG